MTTRRDAVDEAIREVINRMGINQRFVHDGDRAIYDRACEDCAKAIMDFGEDSNYSERYAAVCSALKSDARQQEKP